jgi:hypothetical protein
MVLPWVNLMRSTVLSVHLRVHRELGSAMAVIAA